MKVVFLDIDDVVNSDRLIASCSAFDEQTAPPVKIPLHGDPVAIALINKSCQVTGAQAVVSSTWLDVVGWSYTHNWLLSSGFDGRHFHGDPCIQYGPGSGKAIGIADWLKQHPEVATDQICIVDDDPHLFAHAHYLRKRQVVVRGPDGLLFEHYRAIIQKLGKAR